MDVPGISAERMEGLGGGNRVWFSQKAEKLKKWFS